MSPRQQIIEHERSYCVHYDPRGSATGCKAGVDRETMQKASTPSADGRRLVKWGPCIGGHTLPDPCAYCAKWERRSLEHAEKIADDFVAFEKRLRVAQPFIDAWRAKPPQGKREVVTCPVCEGRLHLSQAAGNGHVMARCETEECINLRE